MKIGIIGSGVVGQTLALGAIKYGHEVMIGTNKKEKYADLRERTRGQAQLGSFVDAAKFGDMLVLAVKGSVAEMAVRVAGTANLAGKTVIDVNNPQTEEAPVNGVVKFFTSSDESLMERLQRTAPEANFVKAFNCIGSDLMVNPDFGGTKPTMFVCGNSESAKVEAGRLIEQFGFEVEDLGAVEAARAIEPLSMLWYIPALRRNDWAHALKMIRR